MAVFLRRSVCAFSLFVFFGSLFAQNLATNQAQSWVGEEIPEELIPFTVSQEYLGLRETGSATPQPYKDYILFPAQSGDKQVWRKTSRDVSFHAPEELSKHIGKLWDGGQVTVHPSLNEMWFGGKKKRAAFSRIYRISLEENGSIRKPIPAFDCPEGGDCSDPFIANGGRVLLFASNAPGGYGGWDLYMCYLLSDGSISAPENLGPGVNTAGDERSPVVALMDLFFTASPREGGMGGWDIYMSPAAGDSLRQAQPLPYPINTKFDEWSVSFGGGTQARTETPMERTMWISSNRPLPDAQQGYSTFSLNSKIPLQGVVKTAYPELYNDPKVTVTPLARSSFEVPVNAEGRYYFWPADPESPYNIRLHAEKYKDQTLAASVKSPPASVTLEPQSLYQITLTVRVSGQGSTPGAEVVLTSNQGDSLHYVTDEYGKAVLVMMKPGAWGALISYQGMAPSPLSFELKEGSSYKGSKTVYLQGRSGIFVKGKVNGTGKVSKLMFSETEGDWKGVEIEDGSYGFWTAGTGTLTFCAVDEAKATYSVVEYTTDIAGDTVNLDMEMRRLNLSAPLREFGYNPDPIKLQAGTYPELREVLALMQTLPDLRIRIEAYSSTPGDSRANQRKSKEAAEFAADYLYIKGIARGRVSAKGMGETSPKVSCGENCSEFQNAQNRRIVIRVVE